MSLFISLITLWSHLLGTDPQREIQHSCLSSCTICSSQLGACVCGFQRRFGLCALLAQALQLHPWQLAALFPYQLLLCLLTLQSFLPISSCPNKIPLFFKKCSEMGWMSFPGAQGLYFCTEPSLYLPGTARSLQKRG